MSSSGSGFGRVNTGSDWDRTISCKSASGANEQRAGVDCNTELDVGTEAEVGSRGLNSAEGRNPTEGPC